MLAHLKTVLFGKKSQTGGNTLPPHRFGIQVHRFGTFPVNVPKTFKGKVDF